MSVDILGTNAEAWFNKALRPRKPEGSLGRTSQDAHLDSHTAPELWAHLEMRRPTSIHNNLFYIAPQQQLYELLYVFITYMHTISLLTQTPRCTKRCFFPVCCRRTEVWTWTRWKRSSWRWRRRRWWWRWRRPCGWRWDAPWEDWRCWCTDLERPASSGSWRKRRISLAETDSKRNITGWNRQKRNITDWNTVRGISLAKTDSKRNITCWNQQ